MSYTKQCIYVHLADQSHLLMNKCFIFLHDKPITLNYNSYILKIDNLIY